MPLAFDTTGLQRHDERTWFDPRTGDQVSLTYFDLEPDLPASLEELPLLRQRLAHVLAEAGTLVEAHVVTIDSVPALYQVVKLPIPGRQTGLMFVAALTVPKATGSVVLQVLCQEGNTSGIRESMVSAQIGFENCFPPHPYAPGLQGMLPWNVADDQRWDTQFPEHPLSRARAWAHRTIQTARVDPQFARLPAFRPQAAPEALAPPNGAPRSDPFGTPEQPTFGSAADAQNPAPDVFSPPPGPSDSQRFTPPAAPQAFGDPSDGRRFAPPSPTPAAPPPFGDSPPSAPDAIGTPEPPLFGGSSDSPPFGTPEPEAFAGPSDSQRFAAPTAPDAFGTPEPHVFGGPSDSQRFTPPAPAPAAPDAFGDPSDSQRFTPPTAPDTFGTPEPQTFGTPEPHAFGGPSDSRLFGTPEPQTFGGPSDSQPFGTPEPQTFGSPSDSQPFGTPAAPDTFGSPSEPQPFGTLESQAFGGPSDSQLFGTPEPQVGGPSDAQPFAPPEPQTFGGPPDSQRFAPPAAPDAFGTPEPQTFGSTSDSQPFGTPEPQVGGPSDAQPLTPPEPQTFGGPPDSQRFAPPAAPDAFGTPEPQAIGSPSEPQPFGTPEPQTFGGPSDSQRFAPPIPPPAAPQAFGDPADSPPTAPDAFSPPSEPQAFGAGPTDSQRFTPPEPQTFGGPSDSQRFTPPGNAPSPDAPEPFGSPPEPPAEPRKPRPFPVSQGSEPPRKPRPFPAPPADRPSPTPRTFEPPESLPPDNPEPFAIPPEPVDVNSAFTAPEPEPVAPPPPPTAAGDVLHTVLVGVPIGNYLPLWQREGQEDTVTFWRMSDPDAVRARLGTGVESRSAVDTGRFREAAMFSPERQMLFLMDRFRDDSGNLGGTSEQLFPATEDEAYQAADDKALSGLYSWLGEVMLGAVRRGEFVAVETGGWDVPVNPVVLVMLRTDGREWHSVVETSPVPVGAPVWRDQQPVEGSSQILASPATDQTLRASGLLTRFAINTWSMHPFQLGISFGPNPTLEDQ